MEILKIKGDKVAAVTCEPASGDGCSDKEKTYVEKQKPKDKAGLEKEHKRLSAMTGSDMKPDLKASHFARARLRVCVRARARARGRMRAGATAVAQR